MQPYVELFTGRFRVALASNYLHGPNTDRTVCEEELKEAETFGWWVWRSSCQKHNGLHLSKDHTTENGCAIGIRSCQRKAWHFSLWMWVHVTIKVSCQISSHVWKFLSLPLLEWCCKICLIRKIVAKPNPQSCQLSIIRLTFIRCRPSICYFYFHLFCL